MAFQWKQNLACGSCYKILGKLHQFDMGKTSFEKAGGLTMDKLNFWPLSSGTSGIKEISAQLLTQSYIPLLADNYVLKPHKNSTWKQLRAAMEEVLVDKEKTVSDLAEAIDELIMFEDE